VVARTSAFQFKGKATDVREVGRQLNVGVVVEGSVRRAGEKVRVTATLINVGDGFQLWSDRYDREMKDVFTIQDEICGAIVKALKVKLTGEEDRPLVKKYTENLEAYHHLLKGRYYWNKWTEEGFRRGMEHYSQAIAADPAYAPAYAGLADCFCLLGFWVLAPPRQVMPQAKALALQALALDDTLADAHTSLATVLCVYDWDWPASEREFLRALELNPGLANAQLLYGASYQMAVGRFEEAIATIQRAIDLDPLSLVNNTYLGSAYFFAGRDDEALQQLHRTLDLDPNFAEAWRCLGWAHLTARRLDDAIAAFIKARDLSPTLITLADLAHTLGRAGRAPEARQILVQLQEMSQDTFVSAYCFFAIYYGLGELDTAFEWLTRAYEERSGWIVFLKSGPLFADLASDPRLIALREKVFPGG
jgi:tetratricopeptide (TPR) repeat protein